MTVHTEPLSDAIGYGTAVSRTAAHVAGRLYYATDTGILSRDNGTTWDTLVISAGVMWVPVMTQDVSSGLWYVAVTGSGDAVMTEVPL